MHYVDPLVKHQRAKLISRLHASIDSVQVRHCLFATRPWPSDPHKHGRTQAHASRSAHEAFGGASIALSGHDTHMRVVERWASVSRVGASALGFNARCRMSTPVAPVSTVHGAPKPAWRLVNTSLRCLEPALKVPHGCPQSPQGCPLECQDIARGRAGRWHTTTPPYICFSSQNQIGRNKHQNVRGVIMNFQKYFPNSKIHETWPQSRPQFIVFIIKISASKDFV
ncbi:hypothetical protein U1Q18_052807 [Sarracenia purpurea var. burkii]